MLSVLCLQHGGGDSDSWDSSGGQAGRPQQPQTNQQEDATTFFRDGRRRIDYVLVYEDAEGASRRSQEREKTLIRTVSEKRMKKHETWREKFMMSLMKAGLHMEEVSVGDGGGVANLCGRRREGTSRKAKEHVTLHRANDLAGVQVSFVVITKDT